MRIVGKRTERPPGPRWPTPEEIAFSHGAAAGIRWRHPKGVGRYRTHEEADADMRKMVGEGNCVRLPCTIRRRFPMAWFRRAMTR
jgi:hypothetical protein